MRIAVVGAGLAGLCAAKALLDEGVGEVTVFERNSAPGLETSFANGALLHPSAVDPWNSPGILRFLLKNIGNRDATVKVSAKALPSLIGWGLRFVRESDPARHRAHTQSNVALALYSVGLMQGLRDAGIEYGAYQRGSVMAYRDVAAFDAARSWSAMLSEHGVRSRLLDRDEMVSLEPALKPVAPQIVGAVHNLDDEAGDAHRFCSALAAWLQARGVALQCGVAVHALDVEASRVQGLRLADGSRHRFDAVVLAAAVWSQALCAPLGLRLPVRPAKGYSITLPPPVAGPAVPVVDNGLHIAVVPLADGRLRVAGTAEFRGMDRQVDPARVSALMRQLRALYPQVADGVAAGTGQAWTGLRPMCADGKPLIGATRIAGLYLNTGHGQLGWTTAAASGQLVARVLAGRSPDIDARPFAPQRFGL